MALSNLVRPIIRPFAEFVQRETASGIVLLLSSAVALVLANSDAGIARYFPAIWDDTFRVSLGTFVLEKSLSHWINDGLMALFFLIVGLEIKREVAEGELASPRQAVLPLLGAVGGMVFPAGIYALFNRGTPTAGGWGIPMATDIAFALAVVYLLGNRVPTVLKVFLTALAIADDLGAVLIIAFFYTNDLQINYVYGAAGIWTGLLLLNRLGVRSLGAYLFLGLFLWYFTLKSGVHATIAGVLLAVTIPVRTRYSGSELMQMVEHRLDVLKAGIAADDVQPRDISEELEALGERIGSPAQKLEHQLHRPVAFFIIPLFAFCNTSVVINPALVGQLLSPLPLGIMAGLLIGKPLGISALSWLAVRSGWASLPEGIRWRQLIGVSILAGIGFTMSIFITLLAFEGQPEHQHVAKLAILLASGLAGATGYALLSRSAPSKPDVNSP